MSHERGGMDARVPGGKTCLRRDCVLTFPPTILRSLSTKLEFSSGVAPAMVSFISEHFVDTFLSFISLLCNPWSRETN